MSFIADVTLLKEDHVIISALGLISCVLPGFMFFYLYDPVSLKSFSFLLIFFVSAAFCAPLLLINGLFVLWLKNSPDGLAVILVALFVNALALNSAIFLAFLFGVSLFWFKVLIAVLDVLAILAFWRVTIFLKRHPHTD